MARYLLTGATGLVGTHMLPLFGAGDTVHCLGRTAPVKGLTAARVEFLQADLSEPLSTALLPGELDAVVHLAQSPHYRDFPGKALDMLALNTMAPMVLADHAAHCGARYLFASSGGVYGKGGDGFSEQDAPRPISELGYYLSTKLCTELLVENYAPLIPVTVARLFFVYGPGQRGSALIPRLADAVRDGRPVTLAGERGVRINPIHARDAARALRACLELDGFRKLNVAGPEVLPLRRIAELIGCAVGSEPVFETVPPQGEESIIGDISAMTDLVGAPEIRFAEGVVGSL